MQPRGEHSALRAALARIAQVGLVVEDVVDPVHREVVRNEEEEGAHHEREVHLPRRQEVRGGEGVGRVDPADRARRHEQPPAHVPGAEPLRPCGSHARTFTRAGSRVKTAGTRNAAHSGIGEVLERRQSDAQAAQMLGRVGEEAERDHDVVEDGGERGEDHEGDAPRPPSVARSAASGRSPR